MAPTPLSKKPLTQTPYPLYTGLCMKPLSDNLPPNLASHGNDFLISARIEKNLSTLTIEQYHRCLEKFLVFAGKTIQTVEEISNPLVRSFRLYLAEYKDEKGTPLLQKTQQYYLIVLRAFLRHLAKEGIATLSPEQIDIGKVSKRTLDLVDIEKFLNLLTLPDLSTIEGLRDKCILEILFSTGLRVSEFARLSKDDINLATKEFSIVGKGGKQRIVFLSDNAIHWLTSYFKQRIDNFNPLVMRKAGYASKLVGDGEEFRLSVRSIQLLLEKYRKRAGITETLTPHSIRHLFATDLLSSGADIRSVQELLGHASVATTQIYTHVTNHRLKKIHETFHRKAT